MEQSPPRGRAVFAAIAVVAHAYALLAFGSVFWIDALAYATLGEAMGQPGGLRAFYDGIGTWFYSHLQPGLPLLWLATGRLPVQLQWPAVALLQHALAAWALVAFFGELHRRWPSRWNWAACAVVAALPFYQAAHNAFLTESLASSLLLLGLAAALRLAHKDLPGRSALIALAATIVLVVQVRSYFGLLLAGAAVLLAWPRPSLRWSTAATVAAAVAVSTLAWPVWRWSQTGTFWLPQLGMNKLQTGWWTNPRPDPAVLAALESLEFPADLQPASIVGRGLDHVQAARVARHWRSLGLDDLQVNARAQQAGELLAAGGPHILFNRVRLALTSSGLVLAYCAADPQRVVFPGYTAERFCAHMRSVYDFHAWRSVDLDQNLRLFFGPAATAGSDFRMAFDQAAAQRLYIQSEAYLTRTPLAARDPLGLGRLQPDWLVALALVGWAVLLAAGGDRRRLAIALAWIVLFNAAVNFAAPLGNPRYGYALFPIYAALAGLGLGAAVRRWRARKSGGIDEVG